MRLAVARWWDMHRSLLALRGEAVLCLVPRFSEGVQTTAYPFQDLRSSERFHWERTLRRINTTHAKSLFCGKRRIGEICRTSRFGTGTAWRPGASLRAGPGAGRPWRV